MKRIITNEEVELACLPIIKSIPKDELGFGGPSFYGVPRGGIAPAYMLAGLTDGSVADHPKKADYIIDDLIDSGSTRDRYEKLYPTTPFLALFEKTDPMEWLVFPWEITDSGRDVSAEDIFIRFLEFVGEDPLREGLIETPARMAKAWKFWASGYSQDPDAVFKEFADGGENYDEMVIVDPIPFYSHCEHHMAAIFGEVHIAYVPDKKIAGLSKFGRLVDIFARRLQVQERITVQIADAIEKNLAPLGVAVFIKATHFCIESRGVQKAGTKAKTSALRGVFKDNPAARAEFFALLKV